MPQAPWVRPEASPNSISANGSARNILCSFFNMDRDATLDPSSECLENCCCGPAVRLYSSTRTAPHFLSNSSSTAAATPAISRQNGCSAVTKTCSKKGLLVIIRKGERMIIEKKRAKRKNGPHNQVCGGVRVNSQVAVIAPGARKASAKRFTVHRLTSIDSMLYCSPVQF